MKKLVSPKWAKLMLVFAMVWSVAAALALSTPVFGKSANDGGKSAASGNRVAQCGCNPCSAKNPCNPCGAKNPCNPCAAKNPCNPCAAANPCNPCAANPCNPCGAGAAVRG